MTAVAKLPATIASRYLPVRLIGRGGMGVVYEVVHARTGEHLALKLLLAVGGAPITDLHRFRREARAPAKIKSENVVHVLDADTAPELNDAPFLVMELLDGLDLEQVATRSRPSPATVVDWLRQIAPALDKAHRIGIIHRDLKPENLFLANQEGRPPMVKILDFGIAKITEEGSTATASGQILGTPKYMAPEQATQTSKVTGATDLYALGLVAYRLLVGESYYRGPMMSVLAELLHGVPSAPSARHPHLSAGFDAWFLQACHREPERRFVSASQQVEALAGALGLPCALPAGERAPASPSAVEAASGSTVTYASSVASRRPRSRKRLLGMVGAAFACLAAAFAYRAFFARESTPLAAQEVGMPAPPQMDVGHDVPPATPVASMPQPASATTASPNDPASPSDSVAPSAAPPANVTTRLAPPTPRPKPVKGPEPSSPNGSKPSSAPDPYEDQK